MNDDDFDLPDIEDPKPEPKKEAPTKKKARVTKKAPAEKEAPSKREDAKVLVESPADTHEHRYIAPSSVEVSRDAKGVARWTIKLYVETDQVDQALEEVAKADQKLSNLLKDYKP